VKGFLTLHENTTETLGPEETPETQGIGATAGHQSSKAQSQELRVALKIREMTSMTAMVEIADLPIEMTVMTEVIPADPVPGMTLVVTTVRQPEKGTRDMEEMMDRIAETMMLDFLCVMIEAMIEEAIHVERTVTVTVVMEGVVGEVIQKMIARDKDEDIGTVTVPQVGMGLGVEATMIETEIDSMAMVAVTIVIEIETFQIHEEGVDRIATMIHEEETKIENIPTKTEQTCDMIERTVMMGMEGMIVLQRLLLLKSHKVLERLSIIQML